MKGLGWHYKIIIVGVSAAILTITLSDNIIPGETEVVISKPYGDRDLKSPGRAVIEYYNPELEKAFVYEGDIFIQKEYAPGALRDNVFLVRAYDDNQIYEVSLNDIDRFEARCQICIKPPYCCSDLTIILRDGGKMRGELYCEGSFSVDTVLNGKFLVKPWTEFALKTKRGIVKLRQQSGMKKIDPDLNENLNCAFCNAYFGRIVSCTMKWSSEYKKKLRKLPRQ